MVDKEKLQSAIKQKDGWWATLFSGRVANIFLRVITDIDWITPNFVTTLSLLLCFVACYFISVGVQPYLIVGAVLIQFVFVFDCLDGQLARYRNQMSNFGAWYDRVTDRVKDFLIYFSIAFGYFKIYGEWIIWPLAMTSFFFVYLFDYYVNQDIKLEPRGERREVRGEKNLEENRTSHLTPLASKFLNQIFNFGEKVYKSIPILQFHIGEQYLLISLFLLLNQTKSLLYFVTVLGMFYSIYWPFSKYYNRKPA